MTSIIIPFYNRTKSVIESIKSVLNQESNNWELILIDDSSTKDISEIIKFLDSCKGYDIKLYKTERNSGPSTARNLGIFNSSGKYLTFLDAGDYLSPHFLTQMTETFLDELLFVYCTSVWSSGEIYKKSNHSFTKVLPTLLKYDRPWHTSGILWNKEFITKFNEELRNWEDYLFEFQSALLCNEIKHCPEILLTIERPDSISLSNLSETTEGIISRLKALDFMLLSLPFRFKTFYIKNFLAIFIKVNNLHIKMFENNLVISVKYRSKLMKLYPINTFLLKGLNKVISRLL